MKIGVDARCALTATPRGEGRSLLQLYREIALLNPDWQFVFFGVAGCDPTHVLEAVPGARIVQFSLPGYRWNTWENVGVPWHARRLGIDVYHGFSSGAPAVRPAARVVVTVHDLIPLLFSDGQPPAATHRFRRRLQAGLNTAECVICVSNHTRKDLLRLFPRADTSRVNVVHWGFTAPRGPLGNGQERGRAGRFRILVFAGGGAPRKNALGALRAFARVAHDLPATRLTYIGATNQREADAIRQLSDELQIGAQVEVRGFVPSAVMETLFDEAFALAYLSLYEGFGLPPLEAMGRGVPVLASNRTSIPEVVGDAGILVDPDDEHGVAQGLRRLATDDDAWHGLRTRGVEKAATFTWRGAAQLTMRALCGARLGAGDPKQTL